MSGVISACHVLKSRLRSISLHIRLEMGGKVWGEDCAKTARVSGVWA